MIRDAMIVAGGRGTRLYPLTYTTPKPLLPFCGAPFLEGVIRRLADAGVRRVFLVVGDDTAPFETLRPAAGRVGVDLELVPEPEPLDTAGGVRVAAEDVEGAFFVLNGDILTDVDYRAVADRHLSTGADATLTLTRVEDTSTYGVCVRDGTRIVAFVEKPEPGSLPGHDTVNAGTYVLTASAMRLFPHGPLSFERQVFPGLLEHGARLESLVWEGVWADLGTPERFRAGHRMALDGALRWPSVESVAARGDGVRVADDAEVLGEVVGPSLVCGGAVVEAGARVGPYAVLGRDARVATDAVAVDTVLFEGAVLGTGIQADGLLLGAKARVEAPVGRDVVVGDGEIVTEPLPDGARAPTDAPD